MGLVLSGTAGLVLSGTRESSYQEPRCAGNPQKSARNRLPSNHPNREEYFIFFLTGRAPVEKPAHKWWTGGAAQTASRSDPIVWTGHVGDRSQAQAVDEACRIDNRRTLGGKIDAEVLRRASAHIAAVLRFGDAPAASPLPSSPLAGDLP